MSTPGDDVGDFLANHNNTSFDYYRITWLEIVWLTKNEPENKLSWASLRLALLRYISLKNMVPRLQQNFRNFTDLAIGGRFYSPSVHVHIICKIKLC